MSKRLVDCWYVTFEYSEHGDCDALLTATLTVVVTADDGDYDSVETPEAAAARAMVAHCVPISQALGGEPHHWSVTKVRPVYAPSGVKRESRA